MEVAAGYAHLLLRTAGGGLYACESGDDGYAGRLHAPPPPNSHGQLTLTLPLTLTLTLTLTPNPHPNPNANPNPDPNPNPNQVSSAAQDLFRWRRRSVLTACRRPPLEGVGRWVLRPGAVPASPSTTPARCTRGDARR